MGGGGQSESKQASTSETKTAKQKEYLGKALDLYGGQLGQNDKVWQGQRVAPLTGTQQGAISGAGNYTSYFSTPQQTGMPLFGQTGQATSQLLSGKAGATPMSDTDVQEYFSGKYYQPAMTSLKDDVLPLIDESYAGPGFFGSGRSHARADAVKDTNARLAEQWADLNWNVLQQNQGLEENKAGRQLSALTPAMAFGQMPAANVKSNLENAIRSVAGLDEVFGLGSKEQTQQQTELEAEIMKFAEELQLTSSDDLAVLLSLLGMNYGASSSKGSSSGWNLSIA
jgi:hypothetical protein